MPRAPFDTTADIFRGLTYGNTFLATVDCHLVHEFYDPPQNLPEFWRTHYATMDAYLPLGPQGSLLYPILTLDMDSADVLAIPSGAAINWVVLWTEIITYSTFPVYYRVHLGPYPLP